MRASFLRAPEVGDEQRVPSSQQTELLQAYLDLTTDVGPLHARCVADAGRRLVEGSPIPAYQINTVSFLRASLAPANSEDADPSAVPVAERSSRWQHLCALIHRWHELDFDERLAVAAVLSKLGYWQMVERLIPAELPIATPDQVRLAYLRCNARVKLGGPGSPELGTAQALLARIAVAPTLPVRVRLSAAVNLIVHHAKADRSPAELQRWHSLAVSLVEEDTPDDVQLSVYWRGVSFIPFFQADHGEVRRMLDCAEHFARQALERSDAADQLLELENLHPLLETRGRAAAAAGRLDEAEMYYRALVDHDGCDAKVHVRLADFLVSTGRLGEARRSYQTAAILGAPYTAYAHTQSARCSLQLGEQQRAVASLFEAVGSDRHAVTPLVLLRNLLPASDSRDLLSWVDKALREAVHPHREVS